MTDNINLVDFGKSYKLKSLPPDTPLQVIIEFFNLLDFSFHMVGDNSPDIKKFVEDHPELVEEID